MTRIPFLWTNDDIGAGQARQLRRQLEFLDEHGIAGTFFLVPFSGKGALDEDRELLDLIGAAQEQGHEFHQHGTRHTAFECGVPETWMLDFSPATRRQFDEERLEIEKRHTFAAFVRMLEEGRRVWRRAFGEDSDGFRPGWGAFHGEFYRALDVLGYRWVSSRIVCPTSWLWNQGRWDTPMDFRAAVPWKPVLLADTGVLEIPMTGGDYAFQVPHEEDKIEAMVGLALDEFAFCLERNLPFVMLSHWHGLERHADAGYAVHRRVLPRIIESGQAVFLTMSRLCDRVRSASA